MFKKHRKKKKRKGDSSSDDEDRDTTSSPTTKQKKLSFKEKKELQRKQKDDKRRSKQKCRLCNQIGHLRKECPGIEDGGSGESKYKQKGKSKRDHATYKKSSGKNTKKSRGSKNRGNKNKYEQETNTISLSFPEQFTAPIDDSKNTSFPMIDCSTNVAATIAQINNGNPLPLFVYPWVDLHRLKKTTKHPLKSRFCGPSNHEFIEKEYHSSIDLYKTLNHNGYKPYHFPNSFISGTWLIAENGEKRFVVMQGNHRMAALAHLR